jgi:uncharacterized protein
VIIAIARRSSVSRSNARTARGKAGAPIIRDPSVPLHEIVDAVGRLDSSYLFIQGPPGAGKTYTGSHVIAELLARGKRIAVAANSHKAINNVLAAVETVLLERGLTHVVAVKKSSSRDAGSYLDGSLIRDVEENRTALHERCQLVGGTARLFADIAADQQFDYLFVDEAGQISSPTWLPWVPAHATSCCSATRCSSARSGATIRAQVSRHRIPAGRQKATVPPELGIFLPITWRMCPDVCRFVSDAIYDGRLLRRRRMPTRSSWRAAAPFRAARERRRLRADGSRRLFPAQRRGSRRDPRIYESLLQQSWIDREGKQRRITPQDILVVAPYNLQVTLLRRTLPQGARVGTVDKFQGQEAAVTLVSMTTSSEDDLPRHIEFLFSKNRLNVAISRARCLSIVLANPKLLDTRCRTPAQIGLVNSCAGPARSEAGHNVVRAASSCIGSQFCGPPFPLM